jgi:hypothetical protein
MSAITFKAKPQQVFNTDSTEAYRYVRVPIFTRAHCDMDAFRRHPRYGSFANSDLFPGILKRIRKERFGASGQLRLDRIPEGVSVDITGFLAIVTIAVP